MHFNSGQSAGSTVAAIVLCLVSQSCCRPVHACPFCSVARATLCEQIDKADFAVIATLQPSSNETTFAVSQILQASAPLDGFVVQARRPGDARPGQSFLLIGSGQRQSTWIVSTRLSPRACAYVSKALQLSTKPEKAVDRLAFFLPYLEDMEKLLAADAYAEFAKAPFRTVRQLKSKLDRDRLWAAIFDPQLPTERRGLFLTLLSVCGNHEDATRLERLLSVERPELASSFEAMVAAWLTLRGGAGVEVVEKKFLDDAPAQDKPLASGKLHGVIQALRFQGEEQHSIPRARIVTAFRRLLNRPSLGGNIIADLARWEDWQSLDRVASMFMHADKDSAWVRPRIVAYLRVCPSPQAKIRLDELAQTDPAAFKAAQSDTP